MAETVVRASSLSMYPDCPRRWAAKQIPREVEAAGFRLRGLPTSIGAAVGTGMHTVIGFELSAKLATGSLPNATEAEQRGLEDLGKQIEDGAIWDDVTPTVNEAQIQVVRQARTYRANIGRRLEPIAVERRLEASHPSGLVISGRTDLVVAMPATLIDQKSGKRRAANFAQYGTYTRLLRSHGKPVAAAEEHYILRVPVRRDQPPPQIIPYDIAACEAATEAAVSDIAARLADWRSTGNPGAWLANPSSVLCMEKFCPAHGTKWCAYGRKQ